MERQRGASDRDEGRKDGIAVRSLEREKTRMEFPAR